MAGPWGGGIKPLGEPGMASGGSSQPWWKYPTPLGVPKQISGPHICTNQRVTESGEGYGQPVVCGPFWDGSGHVFLDGVPWEEWFQRAD